MWESRGMGGAGRRMLDGAKGKRRKVEGKRQKAVDRG